MPTYVLAQGVRVRKETFGLLFYNARDTNLTFVKVENPASFFNEKDEFACGADGGTTRLLLRLQERGLVRAKKESVL